MTVLGIALLIALGIALTVRRAWTPVIIGAAAGMPYSAGVVVGSNGVPLFTVAAVGAGVALLGTRRLGTAHWSANAFAVFLGWATIITGAAPWLFAGIRVLVSRGGVDHQVADPGYLGYSISNVAQLGYLLLAGCAALYLVRVRGAVLAAGVALLVGTGLTGLRAVIETFWINGTAPLFDTLPNVAYAWSGDRLRGVFAEPSELAAFSLPAAGFFVVAALRSPGRMKFVWSAACALACWNLLQASSGTAVAASAVFIGLGLVALAVRYVVRGGVGTPWLVIGVLTAAVVALVAGDRLLAPIEELVLDKVDSQSYDTRTGADAFSWGVVAETLGMGAGLGSNRPSSFGMSLLSTVGVPGAAAFVVLVVGIVVAALRSPTTVAAGTALVALLVAKVVGTPDVSTPILWVLIAACAVPAWTRPTDTAPAPPPTTDPDLAHTIRTGARP